jgi:hypothetical protein
MLQRQKKQLTKFSAKTGKEGKENSNWKLFIARRA